MRALEADRDLCERYHPGLLKSLAALPLSERETPGSPVIDIFRSHDGVPLLVPTAFGGLGADVVDAVRIQRAIGSLSPSLAAATAMHHFTVAMLYALAEESGRLTPEQLAVLNAVAPDRCLMASGWAEGRTQTNILIPMVVAEPVKGGYLLSGSKKPCSLSRSMKLLTASVAVPGADGTSELGLALVRADAPGLSVRPFWGNDALAAAESDEVCLESVFVAEELVIRSSADDPGRLDDLQTAGFVWFTLLISSGYVGVASSLVDEVLRRERGGVEARTVLATRVEAAFALLEGTARAVRDRARGANGVDEEAVARVLISRYTAQELLAQTTESAIELLGGIDFIRSAEHSRLATAARALAFHPPGRGSAAQPLLRWFTGGPLELA